MNDEILAKVKAAKSAAELIGIAKENGLDLTGEQAEVLAGGYRFQIMKVEDKMIRLVKIKKYEEQEKE